MGGNAFGAGERRRCELSKERGERLECVAQRGVGRQGGLQSGTQARSTPPSWLFPASSHLRSPRHLSEQPTHSSGHVQPASGSEQFVGAGQPTAQRQARRFSHSVSNIGIHRGKGLRRFFRAAVNSQATLQACHPSRWLLYEAAYHCAPLFLRSCPSFAHAGTPLGWRCTGRAHLDRSHAHLTAIIASYMQR
eukprot:6214809-Pleurochrysis_carterae.AAC.2